MMNKLPWQWVCSIYQAKATTVVHKSTVARTWTNIGILRKCDAAGVLGLLLEQKLTAALRILVFGASTTLESLVRFCDAI
ncbi:unnamed protein product [Prunus armeniaca]